jgi:hypothetical protein
MGLDEVHGRRVSHYGLDLAIRTDRNDRTEGVVGDEVEETVARQYECLQAPTRLCQARSMRAVAFRRAGCWNCDPAIPSRCRVRNDSTPSAFRIYKSQRELLVR